MRSTTVGRTAAAAALLTGTILFAVTSPAGAAPVPIVPDRCGFSPLLCFHDSAGFAGAPGGTQEGWNPPSINNYNCHNLTTVNNKTTAIQNASYNEFWVYDAANCSGVPMAKIYARTANDRISPAHDNRISSFKRVRPGA
jgi:hypothetical protein